MQFGIKIKTINRVLRWTGWRVFVGIDIERFHEAKRSPSQIGIIWYGFGFINELDQDLTETYDD